MEQLRERFLRTYANIPLSLRDDIVLLVEEETEHSPVPISWNVAYLEIKTESVKADKILRGMDEMKLI